MKQSTDLPASGRMGIGDLGRPTYMRVTRVIYPIQDAYLLPASQVGRPAPPPPRRATPAAWADVALTAQGTELCRFGGTLRGVVTPAIARSQGGELSRKFRGDAFAFARSMGAVVEILPMSAIHDRRVRRAYQRGERPMDVRPCRACSYFERAEGYRPHLLISPIDATFPWTSRIPSHEAGHIFMGLTGSDEVDERLADAFADGWMAALGR